MSPMDDFDLFELLQELENSPPQVARKLCLEILSWVKSATLSVDRKAMNELIRAVFLVITEEINNPGEIVAMVGDDPSGVLELITDPKNFEHLFALVQSRPHLEKFGQSLINSEDEIVEALFAPCLVLFGVAFIKVAEETLLETSSSPTYAQAMAALDQSIYDLCQLYFLSKTMFPSLETTVQKFIELEGAKTGGKRKGDKFAPLKKIVLEEYDNRYQGKRISNSVAGLKIYEWIKTHPEHKEELTDENLDPISKNPPALFKKWIGKHLQGATET